MTLRQFASQYPVTARDAKRILILAAILAGIDVIQSYWLQQASVSPWSEANALPLDFFRFGLLGYVAYWPVDTGATFTLLIVFWSLVSWLFPKREERNVA